jgi:two-component system chemotaxis response regulator CheY
MKRCLIVDDSSVVRKVAKRILSGPEMLVGEAADATEALAICAAQMPDVIIVDFALPDMDAIELIRHLATMSSLLKPQIVVCMIEFDVGAIMRSKRAGAAGYILKPFDRTQLIESFRDMRLAA